MSVDICPILGGVPTSIQPSMLSKLVSVGNVSSSSLKSHLTSLVPLLSSSQDQLSALLSLLPLLRSSADLCTANCEKILPLLSKILSRPGLPLSTMQVVFQCLTLLVVNSPASSEVGKLVSSLAPSFINSILSTKAGPALTPSLQLLAVLMSRYPGSCGHVRARLQDKLVVLLGKEGEEVGMELLGKCFSLLPQVGGGGKEGAEHISQYNTMVSSMVATVHSGISTLYSHVREFDTFHSSSSSAPLVLPQGVGGQLERNMTLSMQLDRVLGVLGQLLVRGFPHARVIPVDMLLSIPTRLLSLTLPPASTPSSYLLSSILSHLTCSALSLAIQCVRSLGAQLLPEAGSINSLVVSSLGRVSTPLVRAGLYNLLSAWLEVAGAGSGMEYSARQLFSSMQGDIIPSKDRIMLVERNNTNKKHRKHGGKKGGGGGNNSTLSNSTTSSSVNVTTCSAALSSLALLISSVGPWIDKETHTRISSTILSQLLSPSSSHPLPSLLLSCLTNMLTVSSPSLPSPAQICPAALNLLSHSPALAPQVRAALLLLQTTAQPTRPGLDIQDTHTATLKALLRDQEDDIGNEDENEDVNFTSTGMQTESTSDGLVDMDNTRRRIEELEEALRKAKSAESVARAEVIRKDIELSRAVINAQKRAANDEKIAGEAKKSKISEQVKHSNNREETLHQSVPNAQEVETAESSSGDPKLSVDEMLQDFSAKLNSNLLPANLDADSDSD